MTSGRSIFSRRLRLALKESAGEVQEEARRTHNFQSHTSALERSVKTKVSESNYADIYLNEHIAKYGPYVHQGTSSHWIIPSKKKALRFPKGGRFIFAKSVYHPGTKADPFLYEALKNSRYEIDRIFKQYTEKSLEEVANALRRKSYTFRG